MGESLAGQIAEIWALYIIGAVMIGARIFCRTKLVGFGNYQWDDYLIIAVAVRLTPLFLPVIFSLVVGSVCGRRAPS